MKQVNLFTDFVAESQNTQLALKLLPHCKQLIRRCGYNIEYENGLTTYDQSEIEHFSKWHPIFKEFEEWIYTQVEDYKIMAGFTTGYGPNFKKSNPLTPKIKAMWVSEQFENGFHETHAHIGTKDHISGTFYVNAPEGSSAILFKRLDYDYDSWHNLPKSKNYQEFNSSKYEFWPYVGQNLMWKSSMPHGVKVNKSDSRIAISYNIELQNNED